MSEIKLDNYFDKVYFCAGARNESLLSFFKSPKEFILDERVAAFMALGEAKQAKKIAICTTSGTAVLECLAAICEAFYSDINLTLISADRPLALKDSGAPQTINQLSPLSAFVHHQIEIEMDQEKLNQVEIKPGVNHINICIGQSKQNTENFQIENYSKTLFLFSHGNYDFEKCYKLIKEKTDYFYFEILTNLSHKNLIQNERELLALFKNNTFDSIVRIGHTPLSKIWRVLDESPLPTLHLDSRGLKALSYGELKPYNNKEVLSFLSEVQIKHNQYVKKSTFELSHYPYSQFHFIELMSAKLDEGAHIYLGNSSLIRDFEVAYKKRANFYGNRGANGIDGQISTAIGIGKNLKDDLYICLGDQTFEYDWSALRYLPTNCKIIIFNNGGGRIFERIGIHSEIILEHNSNYNHIAQAFELRYGFFDSHDMSLDAQIIELKVDNEQTLKCFKELK